jgi:hypothetical protein
MSNIWQPDRQPQARRSTVKGSFKIGIRLSVEVSVAHSYPQHRTIVVVDIADFTAPDRTAIHQAAIHDGLDTIIRSAFGDASVNLDECFVENRGDGALILVPPEVSKSAVVTSFPDGLVRALRRHNAVHSKQAAVKLRVAVHAGEVRISPRGAVGHAVVHAFRILDATTARRSLQLTSSPVAFVASELFYDEVVAQDPAAAPEEYLHIPVHVKRTADHAWLRLLQPPSWINRTARGTLQHWGTEATGQVPRQARFRPTSRR